MRSSSTLFAVWVALGSIAMSGCSSDSTSKPTDARPPTDTHIDPIDAQPSDAQAVDAQPVDAQPVDAQPIDAPVANMCGAYTDNHEPNEPANAAPTLQPDAVSNSGWIYGEWSINACLSGSNDDWYRIPASTLNLSDDPGFYTPYIKLRFQAKDSGLCPDIQGCGDVALPSAPENTITINIYGAANMDLLATHTSSTGFIRLDSSGDSYGEDLLIQLTGPAQALYDYKLYLFIDSQGAEDECEC